MLAFLRHPRLLNQRPVCGVVWAIAVALLLSSASLPSSLFAQSETEAKQSEQTDKPPVESETEAQDTANIAATAVDEAKPSQTNESQPELTLEEIFAGELPQSIDDLRAFETHVRQLVKRLKPATVGIQMANAQGSGVIVTPDGYVLTAAHVIQSPNQECVVRLPDGTSVAARTLGMHHPLDYGLLKIVEESEDGDWPYLDVGESSSLNNGQWVVAIGHPGGFDEKRGPVVRVGRIRSNQTNELRSDCTLVGGDSGGPLFDMDGYVVGIHSKIGSTLSTNMHVPVDLFSLNWDDLEKSKETGRAGGQRTVRPVSSRTLGFSYSTLRERIRVVRVREDSNAAEAGLQRGDLIQKVNGKEVSDRSEVEAAIVAAFESDSEAPIKFSITRDNETLTIEIVPAER